MCIHTTAHILLNYRKACSHAYRVGHLRSTGLISVRIRSSSSRFVAAPQNSAHAQPVKALSGAEPMCLLSSTSDLCQTRLDNACWGRFAKPRLIKVKGFRHDSEELRLAFSMRVPEKGAYHQGFQLNLSFEFEDPRGSRIQARPRVSFVFRALRL